MNEKEESERAYREESAQAYSLERQPPGEEKIDPSVLEYVKAATSSSDRARAIMIVLVTASVLVFTALWNTGIMDTGGGWMDKRIEVRSAALQLFNLNFNPADSSLSDEERELYGRAQEFLSAAGLDKTNDAHKARLTRDIEKLQDLRSERIRMIHVPFFGVVFDMNDLGAFAGVTFVVVLLWMRFSLYRELRNLKLAFAKARERGQSKACYDLLAMNQMLTVTPTPGQRLRPVWIVVAKLLFLIPALVYTEQLRTDWETRPIGNILGPKNMNILLAADTTLYVLIIILTGLCLFLSVKIDLLWNREAPTGYS
ncbi:MAG TPA: hypothetical protein VF754_07255 [Pyrinomonadaceae bacterium]